jgi:hypothetical protein
MTAEDGAFNRSHETVVGHEATFDVEEEIADNRNPQVATGNSATPSPCAALTH